MGIVYRARAPGEGDVAIKVLRRDVGEEAAKRFERERRLLGELSRSEGFVPLLDQGDAELGPYLVMPFLAGGTLAARLRHGPLEVEDAVEIGLALARALGHAHER